MPNLRLDRRALTLHNSKLYYEGALFTGLAFERDGHEVRGVRNIKLGVETPMDTPQLVSAPTGALQIDDDHPDLTGEPDAYAVKFRGELFTGLLYLFDGIYCTSEIWLDKGWPEISVGWHRSGQLETYERYENQTGGLWEWHENGELAHLLIVRIGNLRFSADFTAKHELESLTVALGFFEAPPSRVEGSPFPGITRQELLALPGAPRLCIFGDGIDASWISDMHASGVFDGCEELVLMLVHESVAGFDFLAFTGLRKLARLDIERISEIANNPSLAALARARPDMQVEVDRVRIVSGNAQD